MPSAGMGPRRVRDPCCRQMSRPREDSPLSGRAPGPCRLREGRTQLEEGTAECRRPRPALVETEHEPSYTSNEHRRDVKNALAEGLRLCFLERSLEAGHLRPGEERSGDETDGHPGEVLGEAREGQVL